MNIIPKLQEGGNVSSLFTTYRPVQTPHVQAPQSVKLSNSDKESLSIKSSSKDEDKEDTKGKLTEKDLFNMIKDVDGLPNEMKSIITNLKRTLATESLVGTDTGELANTYLSSLYKLKLANQNKKRFDESIKEAKDNGSLGEAAITLSGKLLTTDKNGNINIIDPIDGKLKKYSKSSITSGMTNAWAYDKPIGYGPVSTLKNVITNGLSDETKKMIVNNLGLVQNAISNVPQIMLDTMEGVFKVAAKAIVTPIAVPIEFAVKSLGIIGKLIAGDTSYLTTEEIHSSSNTTSMLTKMSNSLRKTYSSSTAKVSTSKVSVNKLRSTTNKTSNNTNILTKARNWITGKSRQAGNGYGSIGYGLTNTNRLVTPSLSMPGMNNDLANINNGQAGPVSYEYIYDANYKHGLSMGLSSAQASDAANAQAASTWKKTTGNDTPSSITNTKGSSTEGIKYNTADGKPKSKSSRKQRKP